MPSVIQPNPAEAEKLSQMKDGDQSFEDNAGNALTVGAKLRIENVGKNLDGLPVTGHPNMTKSLEIRYVREDVDEGVGEFTGFLRREIFYVNGQLERTEFVYYPIAAQTQWSPDDFCVNPAPYHKAQCVKASIARKMCCVCDIAWDLLTGN